MKEFEDMSNEELLKLYNIYYDTIFGKNACYGTKDLKILLGLENEITKREE